MTTAAPQAKKPLCFLNCAKNGDVISSLPIARHYATAGPVPYLHNAMVTHLLLGCSYVERVPLRLSPNDAEKGLRLAAEKYERVINLQQFGKHYTGSHEQPHNIRAFLVAGLTVEDFHDLTRFPLVFDRRDVERESFLYRTHVKTSKPLMLLALSCSRSSPFPAHHIMIESLRRRWEKLFEIVDLCRINAPRLYDMIGLLERAALLITSDGSLLHLSAAVPRLPLIYLVGDNRLTAAAARQAPALTVKYSEWHRRMGEIHGVIQARVHPGSATQ